jgi:lipopolysaccharide export LptBFGC system permease protein LptF
MQAINREAVVPQLAELLTRTKDEAGRRDMGEAERLLTADARGRLFYARQFNLQKGTISGLWILERDAEGLITRRIVADGARWREGAWILTNGRAESRIRSGTTPQDQLTPVNQFETDLSPTVLKLRRFQEYKQNLSTRQISEMIERYESEPTPPKARIDELERIRFSRDAALASNLLSLLICMPFFLQREPRNMIVQSLLCAPVALICQVGGVLGASVAIPGLPPQLSVFIPVMVLLPLAIASMTSVKS